MIRFEILGHQVLLYEVAYINVPTLGEEDMLKDKEYSEIRKTEEEDKITVVNK